MATMNISLPEPMKAWVEAKTRGGQFANSSDYVRHLIRRDQERADAVAAVQAALTAGVESGPPHRLERAAFRAKMRGEHGG